MSESPSQPWVLLSGLLVAAGVIYLLAPILTPFLLAALLAYLGDPLADRLEAWSLPRTASVVVVFLLLMLLIALVALLLVPLVGSQARTLVSRIPEYLDWLQRHGLPWVEQSLGIELSTLRVDAVREASSDLGSAGGILADLVGYATRSGAIVIGWVINLFLIPVVTFFLLRDWDVLIARIRALLPPRIEPTVSRLARESDAMLGGFLRGQLLVMLALGVIYTVGLWLVGVEFALLIGMLAGLVSFVPFLGVIVGLLIAGTTVLFQTQDIVSLLLVGAVFAVGQLLEGMILTPQLVGDRIRLHPVAVIFAVLAGGQLFGFFGVLLALPVAAVGAVLARYAHERYTESTFYAGAE